MKVLESIMRDPLFVSHAKSYAQGVYLDEDHVLWRAQDFGFWAGTTFGAVALALKGHVVALTFRQEDGFIAVGRGLLPETPAGLFERVHLHTGNGYIVLYEGKTDEIGDILAGISPAANDRQQKENTPLLH